MLHSLYVSYYSLQSYSSSTGDACYTVYTFPTIPCRATVALQEMLHRLYVSHYSQQLYRRCYRLYVSYYSLQSHSSSTGDATQPIRFLLFPVQLQQLYRRCYAVYTFPTKRFLLFPVELQQLDASQSIHFLLFPVELQEMLHSLQIYSGSTGDATVALQEMLRSLYISYYSLWRYSSSTGDATQSQRFLLFPVALQQLYRRCCTLYTFPTITCRATVALQEMLHSLHVSFYSLQSYCTVALQEMLHSLYASYYSLQSHSSSTGDATQSIPFLLFPVERQQLYRRCYTVYTFPTIPCRDATQSIRSLQSYSSPTGDATQSIRFLLFPVELQQLDATQSIHFLLVPVEIQQLYRRCYTVYTFLTIPCRATVALHEMQHSLQIYSGSTGDAIQSIRFLLFPVELKSLYRRCYTVYTFPTIPCRDTVALQEMLHSLYVSYYSMQSYSSSTGDATPSIRFLLFPVELQQLYRRCALHSLYVSYYSLQSYSSSTGDACYTVCTFPTIPCRATVALQEMLHSLYVSYYSLQSQMLHNLYVSFLFPVVLQQLYRRCYTLYTFPTIPCRATVALQEHV